MQENDKECCESCVYFNTDTWKCQCSESKYYGQERMCYDYCDEVEW